MRSFVRCPHGFVKAYISSACRAERFPIGGDNAAVTYNKPDITPRFFAPPNTSPWPDGWIAFLDCLRCRGNWGGLNGRLVRHATGVQAGSHCTTIGVGFLHGIEPPYGGGPVWSQYH